MKELLHTPEGVRDVYGREYARKQELEERIRRVFARFGYPGIQTPTFEFFDIFNQERGSVASRDMFKFFDREGNTLVLRPDMTPAIARSAAKYYKEEELPVRLSYLGHVFVNNSRYQGRLSEITQAGAEYMGDASCEADAEMVVLAVKACQEAGLTEFQVDIGQVEFFNGLIEEAGLSREVEEELRTRIEAKNFFSVEDYLKEQGVSDRLTRAFLTLPQLFGSLSCLEEAEDLTDNERSRKAIRRLKSLYEILREYGVEDYISFDLGMLGKYQYYTGLIFRIFTYGTGEPLGGGGRYDNLLRQFGQNAPAVGFGLSVDQLMMALSRQNIDIPLSPMDYLVTAGEGQRKKAIEWVTRKRAEGKSCLLLCGGNPDLPGDEMSREKAEGLCRKYGCRCLLAFEEGAEEGYQCFDMTAEENASCREDRG